MTRTSGHPLSALAAAGVGATTAFAAGAMDPLALGVVLGALAMGWGRRAGWGLSRVFERPRLFTILSGLYLPILVVDLVVASRTSPVHALVRLVVFLLVAELLAGNPARVHKLVLLGLLLLVTAAAETTEIWFALPLVGFAVAAAAALLRATLLEHQPCGADPDPPRRRSMPVAAIVAGSMLLGAIAFLAIPRIGAGWGRQLSTRGQGESLETGLSDSMHLGVVGRVKKRRSAAFIARLRGARLEPESIYWRARTYALWTGEGWEPGHSERSVLLPLPAGVAVALPGERGGAGGGPLEGPSARPGVPEEPKVEIETKLDRSSSLVSPGRATWVRTPRESRVLVGLDGSLTEPSGKTPRRYEIGLSLPHEPAAHSEIVLGSDPRPFPGDTDAEAMAGIYVNAGPIEPEVAAWAARTAPRSSDPLVIARAFISDLSVRPYSLDTRSIDPQHPIASFLAGSPAHCEYFASAMALGLRTRGIPARVVAGYLGAEKASFSDNLLVRESRAHLWVEAYLRGAGWTIFDPTPEAGRVPAFDWQYTLRDAWETMVRTWDSTVIGLDMGDQTDLLLRVRSAGFRAWTLLRRSAPVLGVLGLGTVLLTLVHHRRRKANLSWGSWKRAAGSLPGSYRRLLSLAARRGFGLQPAETAREFAVRAGGRFGDPDAVWLISRLYEKERFGGRAVTPAESAAADEALGRLRLLARRHLA